jgi:CheY-like chemotaxis protein
MADLTGLRALVVEDETVVALLIESMLEDFGCVVVASAATLEKALSAAHAGSFDFAVLDVNLDGKLVFPVANVLSGRKLPFIFSTGYGRVGVPEVFKGHEVLNKPFSADQLKEKLCLMLSRKVAIASPNTKAE